jgi:hypothetical protein
MPKKTKLKSLTETHGKLETKMPTSLDEVWGYNYLSRYGTINEQEYESKLREFTRSDLENEARAQGSIIVEDSERIKKELMKLFRSYVLSLNKPSDVKTQPIKITPEIKRILNEGR